MKCPNIPVEKLVNGLLAFKLSGQVSDGNKCILVHLFSFNRGMVVPLLTHFVVSDIFLL